MRRDRLYLADIVEACQKLTSFVQGRGRPELDTNELLQGAILHNLTVIGEAASKVSEELRDRHPEVARRQISGMRNYVVHAYFSLDLDIVWDTVTVDVPVLRAAILSVTNAEFGHGDVVQ